MTDAKSHSKTHIELRIGNERIVVGSNMPSSRKGQSFDVLKKALKKASRENLLKTRDSD